MGASLFSLHRRRARSAKIFLGSVIIDFCKEHFTNRLEILSFQTIRSRCSVIIFGAWWCFLFFVHGIPSTFSLRFKGLRPLFFGCHGPFAALEN